MLDWYERVIQILPEDMEQRDSFCDKLKEYTQAKIVFQDERLSSVEAEDILLEANVRREKRKKIMPVSSHFTVEETVSAMKNYSQKTGRRIIIEYILIKGFNMGREDADELAKLFSGV